MDEGKLFSLFLKQNDFDRKRAKVIKHLSQPSDKQLLNTILRKQRLYDPFTRYLRATQNQRKKLIKEKTNALSRLKSVFKRVKKAPNSSRDLISSATDAFLDPYRKFAKTDFAKRIFTKPSKSVKDDYIEFPHPRKKGKKKKASKKEVFIIPTKEQPTGSLLKKEAEKDVQIQEVDKSTPESIPIFRDPATEYLVSAHHIHHKDEPIPTDIQPQPLRSTKVSLPIFDDANTSVERPANLFYFKNKPIIPRIPHPVKKKRRYQLDIPNNPVFENERLGITVNQLIPTQTQVLNANEIEKAYLDALAPTRKEFLKELLHDSMYGELAKSNHVIPDYITFAFLQRQEVNKKAEELEKAQTSLDVLRLNQEYEEAKQNFIHALHDMLLFAEQEQQEAYETGDWTNSLLPQYKTFKPSEKSKWKISSLLPHWFSSVSKKEREVALTTSTTPDMRYGIKLAQSTEPTFPPQFLYEMPDYDTRAPSFFTDKETRKDFAAAADEILPPPIFVEPVTDKKTN